MMDTKRIAEKLKLVREARGLMQQDLAGILGVTRPTYVNIEAGRRELTVSEVGRLRESLNLSWGDLLDGDIVEDAQASAEKFKQMYLYILHRHFFETGVTKTKLAKLLYLADFAYFYENLESMSRTRYIRREYGPVSDLFFEMTDWLYEQGVINIKPLDYAQMVELSSGVIDYSGVTGAERRVIDRVCEYWKGRRTSEIVRFTHSQKPWKSCRDGEEIPYSLIIQEEPNHVFAPIAAK